MADVNSKNMYALLGNDPEYDSDREPEPPAKAVDKSAPRQGKRDGPGEKKTSTAPTAATGAAATGGSGARGDRDANRRRGGFNNDERSFRDRTNASRYNREHPVENTDGQVRGRDSGPGTQRYGRGPRGPRRGGDRHSRTGRVDDQKQIDQGWGAETGEAERADEIAGENIAKQEIKESGFDADAGVEINDQMAATTLDDNAAPAAEAEPEDNSISYADYIAKKEAAKNAELGLKEARSANEGAKDNKKWASAQALAKSEGDSYFEGGAKKHRQREREQSKQLLDIDYSFKEERRDDRGGRGGRGRGRGGRGGDRGGDRGGERGGEYRGRGGYRGDRGDRADRGDRPPRGDRDGAHRGRGGRGQQVELAVTEEAFPSLGGK